MAEQAKSPLQLQDVINYRPDDYFNEAEVEWIKRVFTGETGKLAIKVLRKALIPTIADPELPLEQFKNDFFLAGRDYSSIPEAELKSITVGRQEALKFIAGGLIQLQVMANSKAPSTADKAKDSAK